MRLTKQALEEAGLPEDSASTGVDVVGDIAIVRVPGLKPAERRRFGESIMKVSGKVSSVYEQVGGIEGELRLRKLRLIAGSRKTLTIHRENGCAFKVDVRKCYFSPRLATERLRVADDVGGDERVLNMFAGVGPYSIVIAKRKHARVTSCEFNAFAAKLHVENNFTNRVEALVEVFKADVSKWAAKSRRKFDRVIMPHPSQTAKFLPLALSLAGRGAVIHYYTHVLGRDDREAADAVKAELGPKLTGLAGFAVRKVREVGPRWVEMAADIRLD